MDWLIVLVAVVGFASAAGAFNVFESSVPRAARVQKVVLRFWRRLAFGLWRRHDSARRKLLQELISQGLLLGSLGGGKFLQTGAGWTFSSNLEFGFVHFFGRERKDLPLANPFQALLADSLRAIHSTSLARFRSWLNKKDSYVS
jgi:hypothetical protein